MSFWAFWMIAIAMALVLFARILTPLVRPPRIETTAQDVIVYKAQLAEVDRDVARGVVGPDEADQTRSEIARRLLAAADASAQSISSGHHKVAAIVVAGLGIGLTFGLYGLIGGAGQPDLPLEIRKAQAEDIRSNRPTQAAAAQTVTAAPAPDFPEDYMASVARLRDLMPDRADDLKGWELLTYHEARLRNFTAAAEAQAKVIDLKGTTATPADLIRHADLLVAAADGYVSPEAEARARQVLEIAPSNLGARYYLGSMFDQTGRPDLAFRIWRPILAPDMPETAYSALVRTQIERAAFFAGVTYTIPERPAALDNALPGPSADMMAAAQEMSAEERQDMISGMVAGLAERLATEGGSAQEWARLINAYGVLGRNEDAQAVLQEAQTVFAGSAEAMTLFDDIARRMAR